MTMRYSTRVSRHPHSVNLQKTTGETLPILVSIIFFNLVTLANGFCGTYFAPVNASSVTQTTTPSRFVSDKAQQLLPKLLQISLFLGVLLASRVSSALDPNRLISQYGH